MKVKIVFSAVLVILTFQIAQARICRTVNAEVIKYDHKTAKLKLVSDEILIIDLKKIKTEVLEDIKNESIHIKRLCISPLAISKK
jgi:hypothetical protein